jgi:hypothetical protein
MQLHTAASTVVQAAGWALPAAARMDISSAQSNQAMPVLASHSCTSMFSETACVASNAANCYVCARGSNGLYSHQWCSVAWRPRNVEGGVLWSALNIRCPALLVPGQQLSISQVPL